MNADLNLSGDVYQPLIQGTVRASEAAMRIAGEFPVAEGAAALPVHHKTLRYRLDKIEELSGLHLDRHPDRIRASIALELLRLAGDPAGA